MLTRLCFALTWLLLVALAGISEGTTRQRRQGFNGEEECTTPRGEAGVCTNIKGCPRHLDYLLNKRHEPGVVEYLQAAVCRRQDTDIITCCPLEGEKIVNFEQNNNRCQTPRSVMGECINIKRCPELLDLLQRRSEPGVKEYLRSSLCGYESRDPKVCCPQNNNNFGQLENNNGGQYNNNNNGGQYNNNNNGGQMNDQYNNNNNGGQFDNQDNSLPGTDVCGLSNSPNNRVVNGQPAALGSWPWMVALGYRSNKKPLDWLCGGSLINNRFILTAAHCVTNIGSRKLILARMGDLNLNDDVPDQASPVDMQVEKAIPHESYNAALHTTDIALVKLVNRVQFSKLIRPICLPTQETFRDLSGYSPFVTGWGATSYRGPSTTALQEAQLDVTDLDICADAYRSIKGATIDNRVICAISPDGKDACQGDSGGPLILPKTKNSKFNFYLIGVVSYGYKCAEPGYPGIYSRVSLYTDWIKTTMKNS